MLNNKSAVFAKVIVLFACTIILLPAFSQQSFSKVGDWMKTNLEYLGGRAVVVVWKDGKIVYNHAENNLNQRQKMIGQFLAKRKGLDPNEATKDFTSTTRERIASCSKWLSAALVMTFVDEGKLSLEDTVGKYLPILSKNGKGSITIWQCLSHLTGIKGLQGKDSWTEMTHYKTMDEAIASIAKQEVECAPGEGFHYGNTGLQIAAAIIEKIGKKDFETLFQERIAGPCDMKQTDFGKVPVPQAAGGAFSTAEDYINFMIMLLNDGKFNGKQVLTAKSVIAMQHNYRKNVPVFYSPAEAKDFGYGFGEWTMDETQPRSNAVTSPGLFGTFPWVDNQQKYVAILFSFNIKSDGRNERYVTLKSLVDKAIAQ